VGWSKSTDNPVHHASGKTIGLVDMHFGHTRAHPVFNTIPVAIRPFVKINICRSSENDREIPQFCGFQRRQVLEGGVVARDNGVDLMLSKKTFCLQSVLPPVQEVQKNPS
jgi:hypothetical protein